MTLAEQFQWVMQNITEAKANGYDTRQLYRMLGRINAKLIKKSLRKAA